MTSVNTDDFAPEVRNAAWWSGDSRLAANGRAADAILVKQGKKEPPDLSEVEEVQMGKVMEPTIARLFQDKHKIELKDADYVLSHKTEPWLKSHFDYISANGRISPCALDASDCARADENRVQIGPTCAPAFTSTRNIPPQCSSCRVPALPVAAKPSFLRARRALLSPLVRFRLPRATGSPQPLMRRLPSRPALPRVPNLGQPSRLHLSWLP